MQTSKRNILIKRKFSFLRALYLKRGKINNTDEDNKLEGNFTRVSAVDGLWDFSRQKVKTDCEHPIFRACVFRGSDKELCELDSSAEVGNGSWEGWKASGSRVFSLFQLSQQTSIFRRRNPLVFLTAFALEKMP